jgi:Tfp pilus assembly protein PilX
MWYVLLGVLIGLMTMTLIMTILSFKYLKSSTDQQKNKANEIEE